MADVDTLKKKMASLANPKDAKILSGFFKTGKGQYGEGDIFLGIKVPVLRKLSKEFRALSEKEILGLFKSSYHEHRMAALFILVLRYERPVDESERERIFNHYLAHTQYINNWDLVDLSAPNIVGTHLLKRDRKILYTLAKSKSLWERRIAILATFAFIKAGETREVFAIADLLINDTHDLIHKAVGWMLREVGKRVSEAEEKAYLEPRYRKMPRTMLRYAIERFGAKDKAYFMAKD